MSVQVVERVINPVLYINALLHTVIAKNIKN
jgi:hypothetical protein